MTVVAQRLDGEMEVYACKTLKIQMKWDAILWRLRDKLKDTYYKL